MTCSRRLARGHPALAGYHTPGMHCTMNVHPIRASLSVIAVVAIPLLVPGVPAKAAVNGTIAYSAGDAVWVADPGGDTQRRLLADAIDPVWSPDGEFIAFVRPGSPDEIWVAAADGSEERFVTAGFDPAWSPDGTRIAFDTERRGMATISIDGTGRATLGDGAGGQPDWSPDGTRIAFSRRDDDGRHLMLIDVASEVVTPLTGGDGDDFAPAWSPDGATVTFVSTRFEDRRTVWSVGADGSNRLRLTATGGDPGAGDGEPAWSPNGAQILFTSDRTPDGEPGPRQIWRMDPDGTDERLLVPGIGNLASPTQAAQDPFENIWMHTGDSGVITVADTLVAHTNAPPSNTNFALWGTRGSWDDGDALRIIGRAHSNQTGTDAQMMSIIQAGTDPAGWPSGNFSSPYLGPRLRIQIPVYPIGPPGSEDWQAQLIYLAEDGQYYFWDHAIDGFTVVPAQAGVIPGHVTDGPVSPSIRVKVTRAGSDWRVRIVEDATDSVWVNTTITDLKDTGRPYWDIHGLMWSGDGTQEWSVVQRLR